MITPEKVLSFIVFCLVIVAGLMSWWLLTPSTDDWGYVVRPTHEAQLLVASTVIPTTSPNVAEEKPPVVVVEEIEEIEKSTSPTWWLSSGAYFYIDGEYSATIIGELPEKNKWRLKYAQSNPRDTDDGYHPQNIFRLTTKSEWENFEQQAYFLIKKNNLSDSEFRNASNGLLLFNRYQDEFNLYYTGIRVDGAVVIKKKINGVYYTMAYKKIIDGDSYDRAENSNLLPIGKWIGLKSRVKTLDDGRVEIILYTDMGKTGTWTEALRAVDDGSQYGGGAILDAGYGGIRTDFMDVVFTGFSIKDF